MYSLTLFHVIRFVLSVHDNVDIRSISPSDCGGVLWTNFVVRKAERLLSQRCRQPSRKLRDLIWARGIFPETSAWNECRTLRGLPGSFSKRRGNKSKSKKEKLFGSFGFSSLSSAPIVYGLRGSRKPFDIALLPGGWWSQIKEALHFSNAQPILSEVCFSSGVSA